MPYLERATGRIFYETELSATPRRWITLVNGFSRPSNDFRALSKQLATLGFSVLRFDNRGAGQTEAGAFTFEDLVEDVFALWEEVGISHSSLLGVSFGGAISMSVTLKAQERGVGIDSLILVSTAPKTAGLLVSRDLTQLPPPELEQALSLYVAPEFTQKNPVLVRSLVRAMAAEFRDPERLSRLRTQREVMADFDFTSERFPPVPVLVIHGERDQVILPQAADIFRRLFSNVQIQLVSGVGHLFLAESPKLLYEIVEKFLIVLKRNQ